MRWLYDLGIIFYGLLLRALAPFHTKAGLWVAGRKDSLAHISQTIDKKQQYIWFHFASLGEFEQGRAVLEQIRRRYPQEKIIITFFSPSGYEVRKHTALADHVFYLPEDTAANARQFIALIQPKFVVFTKYEYWFHYFRELHEHGIRLLMISAIFRDDQLFFKCYGTFYRSILKYVSFFFTQNMESVYLLKSIGITHAGLAGDTRFDRVLELPLQHKGIAEIEQFVGESLILVAGSTWKPDEELLKQLMDEYPDFKMIVAPHEVHRSHVDELVGLFEHALLFSQFSSYTLTQVAEAKVLIIDNIGMLSSLYHYGDIAYVGGGFGVGIHNTLEAVTYGVPVIFGPRYDKFQEAIDLVTLMVGFPISNYDELKMVFDALSREGARIEITAAARNYVQQRAGATQIIMKYLETERLLS